VAQQVGGLLAVDSNALLADFNSGSDFIYIRRQVELDTAQEILSLGLGGVYSHEEAKRVYPTGSVASQVVGFVNLDGIGGEGIEFQFEETLRGVPGTFSYESAPDGVPIPWAPATSSPAVPGDDLVTTIDVPTQYAAESACQETLVTTGARGCWIVAMEVETGEILAVAGAPTFDPQTRVSSDGTGFANFAVRGMYEPGSTIKLITIAGAIEDGIVTPNTVIGAVADQIELREGACKSDTDEVFGCYSDFEEHETYDMSVAEIFRQSSNVGTIKVAQMLDRERIFGYLSDFGLGAETGLDFPGEAGGLINQDPSCQTCPISAAIGYGVAATAVQMAAAYATVGNDGIWIQPHLVQSRHETNGGSEVIEVVTRQVISAGTAATMRQLLAEVVEVGTGISAQVPGYLVGGKTGTANKLGDDGRYTDITMASFVGMAPIDDPRVVVAVVVDAPAFEFRTGGAAAAPAFARVIEQALHRLGVTPDANSG
jgi:cell division protein FtsI/penicillin-binding protein 2